VKYVYIFLSFLLISAMGMAQVDSTVKYNYFNQLAKDYNILYQQVKYFCTQRGGGVDTIRQTFSAGGTDIKLVVPSINAPIRLYIKNNYLDSLKLWKKRANDSADAYVNGNGAP
jgi:hypothetical protein